MKAPFGRLLLLASVACSAPALDLDYVAPEACARCHKTIAESYGRTGMARTFGAVKTASPFPELRRGEFQHKASRQSFSMFIRDGAAFLRRHQVGFDGGVSNVVEHRIDYWFGSGDHARSYVSRTVAGDLIELPVTWYAEQGGRWGMSPGYDWAGHPGFSRKITYRCMFCHNAYPETAPSDDLWDRATRWPRRLPEGIDCQRCHGPGRAHIEAAQQGRPAALVRAAIVNPARLTARRQMEICLQCHLETTNTNLPAALLRYGRGVFSYRPGEPLGDYMIYFDHAPGSGHDDKFEFTGAPYRLRKSRCYQESHEALICTTCHDPHRALSSTEMAARSSRACQRCHAAGIAALVRSQRHREREDCVSCHMPKRRPTDAVHVTITDHWIQRSPQPAGMPAESSGADRPYRGKVVLYYPETLAPNSDADLYLSIAQVRNQANLKDGLDHLRQAVDQWRPAQAGFYSDLGDAYRHSGRLQEAIDAYRKACSLDPNWWPARLGLGLSLAATGDTQHALAELNRAETAAPWETEIVKFQAATLAESGNPEAAVAKLRSAVAADPDSGDLHNSLGAALTRSGDIQGAEAALREAVRLRPEIAPVHVNLATVLARTNKFREARYEFREALRIDGSSAEAHSAYGAALAAHNDFREAREQFEIALRLNPGLWNTYNNLGSVLNQLGDKTAAAAAFRAAIAIRPDFPTAQYNLGALLADSGNFAEAEQHLREAIRGAPHYYEAHLKLGGLLCEMQRCQEGAAHLLAAAQSPDPALRQAAQNTLSRAAAAAQQ